MNPNRFNVAEWWLPQADDDALAEAVCAIHRGQANIPSERG
jgi:hypothetical protein